MWYLYGAVAGLLLLVCLQFTLDFSYFLRMGIVYMLARYFRKRVHILDTTILTGFCLTTDVDFLLTHMNNARFLRELDFARADFYERTALYKVIQKKGGAVVQGAATIRYRKFIRLCSFYEIHSRVVYWEGTNLYMEHKFVSSGDNFVLAIANCRQRLIKISTEEVMRELFALEGKCPEAGVLPYTEPKLPTDLAKWIESNEISSANLRNIC